MGVSLGAVVHVNKKRSAQISSCSAFKGPYLDVFQILCSAAGEQLQRSGLCGVRRVVSILLGLLCAKCAAQVECCSVYSVRGVRCGYCAVRCVHGMRCAAHDIQTFEAS